MRTNLLIVASLAIATTISTASAQDAEDAGAPPPELPPPTLEVEVEVEPEPVEEPEGPPILERIGPNRRQEPGGAAPRDIPFTVPNAATDARIQGQGLELPPEEPPEPPIFALAIGAGWTRALANIALDYVRLEQRFEARIPDFLGLFVGLGVAELFDPTFPERFIVEVGPRVGFGAGFCDDRLVQCEGVVFVQPGVAAGHIGVEFDFQGALDLRFLIARLVELSAGAALSFIGGTTFVSVTGNVGLRF